MSSVSVNSCSVCHLTYPKNDPSGKLKTCGGCRAVYYCSSTCQRLAWPTHKEACLRTTQAKVELCTSKGKGTATISLIPEELATPLTRERAIKKIASARIEQPTSSTDIQYGIQGREQALAQLVASHQLHEVLPHIQNEPDHDLAIQWLRTQLKTTVHPPLCLELSRIMRLKFSALPLTEKSYPLLIEALAYKSLGLLLVRVDIECMTDPSAQGAYDLLSLKYALQEAELTKMKLLEKTSSEIDHEMQSLLKEKLTHLKQNLALLAPPSWLKYHTMSVFEGVDPTKPQAEWDSIRGAFIEKILLELSKQKTG